jgi:hypothetical protein
MITIAEASRLAPKYRFLFMVSWLHRELDFMTGAAIQDMEAMIRHVRADADDIAYFQKNTMVAPARPALTDPQQLYQDCKGLGLAYWMYSDTHDPVYILIRRKILSTIFGSPKNMIAGGDLHALKVIYFQPEASENQLKVHTTDFPEELRVPTYWLLVMDFLPFELDTHKLYVLLQIGYGLPEGSILNITHHYDVINQDTLSGEERGTPRTIVMMSSSELVSTFLVYKQQVIEDIHLLFPQGAVPPGRYPEQDKSCSITFSTLNTGRDRLPILPDNSITARQLHLRMSREELLQYSQDDQSVPVLRRAPLAQTPPRHPAVPPRTPGSDGHTPLDNLPQGMRTTPEGGSTYNNSSETTSSLLPALNYDTTSSSNGRGQSPHKRGRNNQEVQDNDVAVTLRGLHLIASDKQEHPALTLESALEFVDEQLNTDTEGVLHLHMLNWALAHNRTKLGHVTIGPQITALIAQFAEQLESELKEQTPDTPDFREVDDMVTMDTSDV